VDDVPPWLVLLALLGAAGVAWRWARRRCAQRPAVAGARVPRRWHPRTPADCPACRAHEHDPPPAAGPPSPPSWRERKGRRESPKRVATGGYAGPTRGCPYDGIIDERIPAPVGYGHHGVRAHIRDFRCQACGTKVSARWGTVRYGLKTPAERVGELLGTLAEGLDVAATVRVVRPWRGDHRRLAGTRRAARGPRACAGLAGLAPAASPTGRDPHPAAVAARRPLALARARSPDEARTGGLPGSPHAGVGPRGHPRLARPARPRLRAARHERRVAAPLRRAHPLCWPKSPSIAWPHPNESVSSWHEAGILVIKEHKFRERIDFSASTTRRAATFHEWSANTVAGAASAANVQPRTTTQMDQGGATRIKNGDTATILDSIGRRGTVQAGLKIPCPRACGFESHRGHHPILPGIAQKSTGPHHSVRPRRARCSQTRRHLTPALPRRLARSRSARTGAEHLVDHGSSRA